jgi:hypothetical protein
MNTKLFFSLIVLASMLVGSMVFYLDLISGTFLNGLLVAMTFVWFGGQFLFVMKSRKS